MVASLCRVKKAKLTTNVGEKLPTRSKSQELKFLSLGDPNARIETFSPIILLRVLPNHPPAPRIRILSLFGISGDKSGKFHGDFFLTYIIGQKYLGLEQ